MELWAYFCNELYRYINITWFFNSHSAFYQNCMLLKPSRELQILNWFLIWESLKKSVLNSMAFLMKHQGHLNIFITNKKTYIPHWLFLITILAGIEGSKYSAWKFLIQQTLRTDIDIAKNFHSLKTPLFIFKFKFIFKSSF